MLPSTKVHILKSSKFLSIDPVPLSTLLQGKLGVIDLWHSKCVKCPAALEKLNEIAGNSQNENLVFIAAALSQGVGDKEIVSEILEESSWENLQHVFIDFEDKDALKGQLGYSAVPFYVLFDSTGSIIKSGDSKSVDIAKDIQALLNTITSISKEAGGLSFDEDF